jgi:hypothetical protein
MESYVPPDAETVAAYNTKGEGPDARKFKLDFRADALLSDPWNEACIRLMVLVFRSNYPHHQALSDRKIKQKLIAVLTRCFKEYRATRPLVVAGVAETPQETADRILARRSQGMGSKKKGEHRSAVSEGAISLLRSSYSRVCLVVRTSCQNHCHDACRSKHTKLCTCPR